MFQAKALLRYLPIFAANTSAALRLFPDGDGTKIRKSLVNIKMAFVDGHPANGV